MTNERIAEIKARLTKLPKEPWSRETHDVVRGDNRYGSDPYNVLLDDDGRVIADSMNSDLRCVEGNCDDGFIDSGTLNAFDLFVHAAEDLRALLVEVEALTSPPAPSGWQQRIEAMERLSVRVRRHLRDVADCRHSDRSDEGGGLVCIACVEGAIDACTNELGQNAQDALPPVSEASPAKPESDVKHMATFVFRDGRIQVVPGADATCGSCGHSRSLHLDRGCGRCNDGGCECSGWADASPAKAPDTCDDLCMIPVDPPKDA